MANGNPINGERTVGALAGILMRLGWWGVGASLFAATGELSQFFFYASPRFEHLTHFFWMVGVAMMLIGIITHSKRSTDMQATVAAEAKIDRAIIAAAVDPISQPVKAYSTDPAVQRTINTLTGDAPHY